MKLPPEIRKLIWELVLPRRERIHVHYKELQGQVDPPSPYELWRTERSLSILRVSKEVHNEVAALFYQTFSFCFDGLRTLKLVLERTRLRNRRDIRHLTVLIESKRSMTGVMRLVQQCDLHSLTLYLGNVLAYDEGSPPLPLLPTMSQLQSIRGFDVLMGLKFRNLTSVTVNRHPGRPHTEAARKEFEDILRGALISKVQ